MYIIDLTWLEFKANIIANKHPINYKFESGIYEVISVDRNSLLWRAVLVDDTDKTDFENNYKDSCNKCIYDCEGKLFTRAESRPLDATTSFTTKADSNEDIGDGKSLAWDFSNNEDIIDTPSGLDIKRKRIEFSFLDEVYIKEGTFYFHNCLKDSHVDLYVVCMAGGYYYKNDGVPTLAEEDVIIAHYVNAHPIQGSVPMGDELNTESCSCGVPSYYKFWLEITVPDSDNTSNGCMEIEIYRKRTRILE